jgi:O-antigen/teichoic acid export membrane protein
MIAQMTDTETLAMYANASKLLPFEIVTSSFSAVLLPKITRAIVAREHLDATKLYRTFLEISYISTTIMCCAALAASKQLMALLYTKKYLAGLSVFRIYILVDILRFTNITMVLAAAGKTRKLMIFSAVSLVINAMLNIVLFRVFGMDGPAVATFITTLVLGICIMSVGAKELGTRIWHLFDGRFLLVFLVENVCLVFAMNKLQQKLDQMDVHYFLILIIICGIYGLTMVILNGKRLLRAMKAVNANTAN